MRLGGQNLASAHSRLFKAVGDVASIKDRLEPNHSYADQAVAVAVIIIFIKNTTKSD
jgi:hypothetical protein